MTSHLGGDKNCKNYQEEKQIFIKSNEKYTKNHKKYKKSGKMFAYMNYIYITFARDFARQKRQKVKSSRCKVHLRAYTHIYNKVYSF